MLISFAASSASIDVTGMSVHELMISSTSRCVTSIVSSPTISRWTRVVVTTPGCITS